MHNVDPRLLQAAVAAICPDVYSQTVRHGVETDEKHLWQELSTCLLSSQVPYDMAVAAANAVHHSGVLLDPSKQGMEITAAALEGILRAPIEFMGKSRRYRFYRSKSVQLARTCHAIHGRSRSLYALMSSFSDEQVARSWFIGHAAGMGPKQASMFLRNAGFTYELAVLDRHVLRYMSALDLDQDERHHNLKWYYASERTLREHADVLGYPVGLLDWAIWIVMRVARQPIQPEVSV